jgi:hypothetical protein
METTAKKEWKAPTLTVWNVPDETLNDVIVSGPVG